MKLIITEKDEDALAYGKIGNWDFSQKFGLELDYVAKLKWIWRGKRGMPVRESSVYKRNGLKPSTEYNAYIAPLGR